MNLDVFVMGGYGPYVWSAFAFTFFVCLVLFLRTRKILKKLESEFKEEARSLSNEQLKVLKDKKVAQAILTSQQKVH